MPLPPRRPNLAADPIVTRFEPVTDELQVLAKHRGGAIVQHSGSGGCVWGLPGVIVRPRTDGGGGRDSPSLGTGLPLTLQPTPSLTATKGVRAAPAGGGVRGLPSIVDGLSPPSAQLTEGDAQLQQAPHLNAHPSSTHPSPAPSVTPRASTTGCRRRCAMHCSAFGSNTARAAAAAAAASSTMRTSGSSSVRWWRTCCRGGMVGPPSTTATSMTRATRTTRGSRARSCTSTAPPSWRASSLRPRSQSSARPATARASNRCARAPLCRNAGSCRYRRLLVGLAGAPARRPLRSIGRARGAAAQRQTLGPHRRSHSY